MKNSNVVSIGNAKVISGVNEHAVQVLETFLDHAKRGEITCVAVAGVQPNHKIVHDAAHTWNHFLLLAAIDVMHHDVLGRIVALTTEDDIPEGA